MKNKIKIAIVAVFALTLASCSSGSGKKSEQSYLTLIDSLETERKLFFDKNMLPPKDLTLKSVQAYEFFVADYPKHTNAANYLFEAAKRYEIDLQDHLNAAKLYEKVYENYENFTHHAMALFHVANAYHSLGEDERAVQKFEEFIQKHPTHDFADDAQGMINIINMGGEEEFLKSILEKAKNDSIAS